MAFQSNLSRRQFLAGTGIATAAIAAGTTSLGMTGCSSSGATTVEAKVPDADAAKEAAYAVAASVQDEGSVLLKNSGVLPLAAGSEVMPFGYAYLNPIYGQLSSGGSAKWTIDPVTPEEGLSSYAINTAAVELMQAATVVETLEAEGTDAAGEAGSILGGDCKLYEYDSAIYDGLEAAPGTTGIVFVTRSGQEGQDQKHDAYEDGTPHYLALSANERGAIAAAKRTCDSVVLVLVSSAPLELADVTAGDLECDAILYYGHPSERGFSRFSAILSGEVNPSGRTVDTWSADFTADPSYTAIGEHSYTNLTMVSGSVTDGGEISRTFNEYREGMYMGYRYYETAALEDPSFSYDDAVVFPFGHGLSYTTFDQVLDSVVESDGTVTVTVTTTNVGDVAGKDVVEVYYTSPYTELDQEMRIEKPAVSLIDFAKTELLGPGESETVELSFLLEDMASYSYLHDNGDGTLGCYVLEAGDYVVSVRSNSHDVVDEGVVTVDDTLWYDGSDDDHIRQAEKDAQSRLDDEGNAIEGSVDSYVAATNRFQQSSDYMGDQAVLLTRADWANTQPQVPETKEIGAAYAEDHDLFATFDPETDPTYGNVPGSLVYEAEQPTSGADNGLVVSDLRGRDYDDADWDLLLDELDWDADRDGIIQNFSGDAYMTSAIDSIGLPATIDMDGANGLKVNGADSGYDMTKSSSFGMQPLMASTWNKGLLYEVGAALGQESLAHGISGWYSPGINLHRSFFSGRVFEYYSEDPMLSGLCAERVVSGAGDNGLYCYLKHFAMNETDTGRARLICTWADEQTMRELYLRPFEVAVTRARKTVTYIADDEGNKASRVMRAGVAMMATQTCVGTMIGHTNYALLTQVLRQEWGFEGMVISDYWVWNGDNHRDLAFRVGCDTYLSMSMPAMWGISDYDSATSRWAMRRAIKNICFAVANSNALNGMAPGAVKVQETSPWQYGVWAVDAVAVAAVAAGAFFIHRRQEDEFENPDDYKRGKRGERKFQKKLARREAKLAKKAAKE